MVNKKGNNHPSPHRHNQKLIVRNNDNHLNPICVLIEFIYGFPRHFFLKNTKKYPQINSNR